MLLVPPFLLLLFAIDVSPGCASGGELLGAENRPTHDASVRSPSDAKLMEDTGMERSASDAIVDSSAPCAPTGKEACDGLDNDCNGLVDEDFICVLGDTKGPVCVTSCGTTGQRVCEAPACSWGACSPFTENCSNTIDDDCNGLIDCADPVCASSPECSPASDAGGSLTGALDASCVSSVTLIYSGPASHGFIWSAAWWKSPSGIVRPWGTIADCVDAVADDGKLLCTFTVPCGTSPFEFQVYLPDKRFWGDMSFDPLGGKGSTIGTLTLSTVKGPLAVKLVPNPFGAPYYNGRVDTIP